MRATMIRFSLLLPASAPFLINLPPPISVFLLLSVFELQRPQRTLRSFVINLFFSEQLNYNYRIKKQLVIQVSQLQLLRP